MENNNPLIPGAPTPSTSSMPEFASAPSSAPMPAPAPATAMPEFGIPQSAPQVTPQPATEPVAPVIPQAVANAPEPVAEPATEAVASTLGEIESEPTPTEELIETPVETSSESVADQLITTDTPSAVESSTPAEAPAETPIETISPNPTETLPEKKKPNLKLIILAAVLAVVVIAGVVIAMILMNRSNKTDPANAPVSSFDETPDNSVKFDALDKDGALNFLTAVGKVESYFPTDFLDEKDQDVMSAEGESKTILLYSFEEEADLKKNALSGLLKESSTSKAEDSSDLTIDDKDLYSLVHYGEKNCSKDCPLGLSFKKSVFYHNNFLEFDPTGASGDADFTIFLDKDTKKIQRALPILAYINLQDKNQIVYSSEFSDLEAGFILTVNTLSIEVDQTAAVTAEAGEVPYAIFLRQKTFVVDKASGNFIENQATDLKNFPVTAEEATALI